MGLPSKQLEKGPGAQERGLGGRGMERVADETPDPGHELPGRAVERGEVGGGPG